MTAALGRGLRLPLLTAQRPSPTSRLHGDPLLSSSHLYAAASVVALTPCLVVSLGAQARRAVATSKADITINTNSRHDASASRIAAQRRLIHSSERRTTATLAEHPIPLPGAPVVDRALRAPLSVLPLSMILRSLATTVVSSSPILLPPSLRIMAALAHSTNPLLNPDRNPILRYFLKRSFYAQFCAGENALEVRTTIARLKNIGFTGVILGYAKEVVLSKDAAEHLTAEKAGEDVELFIRKEVDPWAMGTMETVRLAEPGDYVALK